MAITSHSRRLSTIKWLVRCARDAVGTVAADEYPEWVSFGGILLALGAAARRDAT
jgi:hypothetical protein